VSSVLHFNPAHTFLCGQCFRWEQEADQSFTGIAGGQVVNISHKDSTLTILNAAADDYEHFWKNYLDLERDYGEIKENLARDSIMKKAIRFGWGIRILRQDFFECLISFIVSANNNIPRIQGILNRFSEMYGDKLEFEGKTYYAFPRPEQLIGITEGDLAPLRAGYRARYLAETINSFCRGEISEEYIASLPPKEARRELCKICGVGPKVADCILLFSMGMFGVFPVDVWVRRVMSELYGCDENEAAAAGEGMFGPLSGIAQQYLFYWRREGNTL